MIDGSTLGERLRGARRTGLQPLATRNRLFVARALFVLAGAGVVYAIGALLAREALPDAETALLLAMGASLAGAGFAALELARSGGSRDAWFSLGLNVLAVVAAVLLY